MELPIEPADFEHYVFLGEGWSVGLAHEAALKLREAAQAWTESYPAMEYRHGPISVAGPRSVVWALGAVDQGVLDAAAATGATVVGGGLDPMAELVVIQRTAVALAEARGLDPDHPRHLARSVVLS
jgi:fructoselysine-6-P-deglycase FrlB-like protein